MQEIDTDRKTEIQIDRKKEKRTVIKIYMRQTEIQYKETCNLIDRETERKRNIERNQTYRARDRELIKESIINVILANLVAVYH